MDLNHNMILTISGLEISYNLVHILLHLIFSGWMDEPNLATSKLPLKQLIVWVSTGPHCSRSDLYYSEILSLVGSRAR